VRQNANVKAKEAIYESWLGSQSIKKRLLKELEEVRNEAEGKVLKGVKILFGTLTQVLNVLKFSSDFATR
jgi:hypothetical protein